MKWLAELHSVKLGQAAEAVALDRESLRIERTQLDPDNPEMVDLLARLSCRSLLAQHSDEQ